MLFNERYLLLSNMNFDLKSIGIKKNSELNFKKIIRRRNSRNGPVRLREHEKDKYIIV